MLCCCAPYHHRLALLLLSPLCLIKSIACSNCVSGNIGERPEPPFGLFRINHEFVLIESLYSLCEDNCFNYRVHYTSHQVFENRYSEKGYSQLSADSTHPEDYCRNKLMEIILDGARKQYKPIIFKVLFPIKSMDQTSAFESS